jgi:hypothetical protein
MVLVMFAIAVVAPPAAAEEAAPVKRALRISLDTSGAPEAAPWARKARKLIREWHPKIARLLHSASHTPATTVKVVFKKYIKGDGKYGLPGHAVGNVITINAKWIKAHPEDWGLIIHELTHVLQGYPSYQPRWLVEGIADYVRYFRFEGNHSVAPVNTKKYGYRDGYAAAARFLAWAQTTYNRQLVGKLNRALRAKTYKAALFKSYTGKSLTRLWTEYLRAARKQQGAARMPSPSRGTGSALSRDSSALAENGPTRERFTLDLSRTVPPNR